MRGKELCALPGWCGEGDCVPSPGGAVNGLCAVTLHCGLQVSRVERIPKPKKVPPPKADATANDTKANDTKAEETSGEMPSGEKPSGEKPLHDEL